MSPDFEWISPAEDPDPGVHRGYDAVEHFWDGWREAVGQLHFEVKRMEERGDQVIVFAQRSGRGHELGFLALQLHSSHPQGGNPMSRSADKGVVDPHFRPHGIDGLHVCDASVFPSAITVNPQLTVMALANYAADRIE